MSASLALIKTVESVNLVFGLNWFAILGGAVTREVRRIARQQKATHGVYAGDDAVSVGVTTLSAGRRGTVLYSAAQLVAQRFSKGAVALIVQLDHKQWWLVALHEGAVIARTDYVCATFEEANERVLQLRHAYPTLTLLNDDQKHPSLSDLVDTLSDDAKLRRLVSGNRLFLRPYYGVAIVVALFYVFYQTGHLGAVFGWREPPPNPGISAEDAWKEALRELTESHWVHGVAGSANVLLSLYALPVQLEGWRLHNAQCMAQQDQWRCHADYGRDDPETSNDRFLGVVPASWEVSFTPLEQAKVRWSFTATGQSLARTSVYSAQHIERLVFSGLQAIRPAFSVITIEAPKPLTASVPFDEHGQAVPQPAGLPRYRARAVRIQAPLRSVSLLLPHSRSMSWQRIALSVDPRVRPELKHSRLNVTLQGVLYEQD